MDEIQIVHLSDLHFGVSAQLDIWTSLAKYLDSSIRPQLILITGDIVNTVNGKLYAQAKGELNKLITTHGYLVCPGNHDRHIYGNASKTLQVITLGIYKRTQALFDQEFGDHVVRDRPRTFPISVNKNAWTVRVIGFDTSMEAKYSAQGFAKLPDLDQIGSQLDNEPVDLLIFLQHHHLLPIAELDSLQQRASDLLSPTIMLNAGTMLRRLINNNVNLVLHGHEHQRHIARYGTFGGGGEEVVVIGAGSATGVETGKGCELSRASANLIELRSDRSVCVREIRHDGSNWGITNDPGRIVMDSRAVRRARSYRINRPTLSPTSALLKCVEFHSNRDISITETFTNWVIEGGRFIRTTRNSSGLLPPAEVEIHWPQGKPDSRNVRFQRDRSRDYTFRIVVPIEDQQPTLVSRVTVGFTWVGGGTLTSEDLNFLEHGKRGEYRNEGFEWVSERVPHKLASLSILVRLPRQFAPAQDQITVFCIEPASQGGSKIEPPELAIQHHSAGVFSIEVAYPLEDHEYVLMWPVSSGITASKEAQGFRERATNPDHARELIEAFKSALPWGDELGASMALYVPVSVESPVLKRTGLKMFGEDLGSIQPPPSIDLREGDSLYRRAWWGQITRALPDTGHAIDGRAGFLLGERALAVVPIKQFGREDEPPWGLVRIGMHGSGAIGDDRLLTSLEQHGLADGVLSMLQIAASANAGA
jgi:predicted MPP superfamily phosphohydrolase